MELCVTNIVMDGWTVELMNMLVNSLTIKYYFLIIDIVKLYYYHYYDKSVIVL